MNGAFGGVGNLLGSLLPYAQNTGMAGGGLPYQAFAGNQLGNLMPFAQNQSLPQMLGAQGDIGFTPMTNPMLAMMGISNPNVMQFRTPQYDQPIMPFGAAPMPAYGYQQQFGTGEPGIQTPVQTATTEPAQEPGLQTLLDYGLLVEHPGDYGVWKSWRHPRYISPYDLEQRRMRLEGNQG